MLTAPAVSESTINSWPIEESGLPARVVHSTQVAGLSTVGELRLWQDSDLLNLHALGKTSLVKIHDFFGLCERLAEGRLSFAHFMELLHAFLDHDEFSVLSYRYGFDLAAPLPSSQCMTLQQIGNRMHRTRERIRQIEESAMQRLDSHLCRSSLVPWHDYFTGMLETADECMTCGELFDHTRQSLFDYSNPCSVLLLLSSLRDSKITYRGGFFSLWPENRLDGIAPSILKWLDGHKGSGTLTAACEHVLQSQGVQPGPGRKHVQLISEHCPDIAVTVNGRIFNYGKGVNFFLRDVMKTINGTAHYRTVAQEADGLLRPASRKGAGFWLKALRSHPGIVMRESGHYELK
ncbi:MAG: sigma factor-like helix-turn-helix DNA-binding protein [Kiritimatiellia bacterium]